MKAQTELSEQIHCLTWAFLSFLVGCSAGVITVPGVYLPIAYLILGALVFGGFAMVLSIFHAFRGGKSSTQKEPQGLQLATVRRATLTPKQQVMKQKRRGMRVP